MLVVVGNNHVFFLFCFVLFCLLSFCVIYFSLFFLCLLSLSISVSVPRDTGCAISGWPGFVSRVVLCRRPVCQPQGQGCLLTACYCSYCYCCCCCCYCCLPRLLYCLSPSVSESVLSKGDRVLNKQRKTSCLWS